MPSVKVCVLRTAGTNCDKETAFAFRRVGAAEELIHVNELKSLRRSLDEFGILALPGGFSYGDDIASGKVFANELKTRLKDEMKKFIADGKLIIGICNGFQVLVKSGLLPGNGDLRQEVTLTLNDSGKFEDRWTYLRASLPVPASPAGGRQASSIEHRASRCVWTTGLPEIIYLPVAHGEGKFVAREKSVLERLKKNRQVVFTYCDAQGRRTGYPDNPNGSRENIAGICDETGRILGLMPHPERHIDFSQNPRWTAGKRKMPCDGLQIFHNGVDYFLRHG